MWKAGMGINSDELELSSAIDNSSTTVILAQLMN